MLDFEYKKYYVFEDLVRIIKLLRGEGGCPWDREQTHESIRRNFIEETYEACEAIDEMNPEHLKEELGDVLTQVVFHADMEDDAGNFNIDDVCDRICQKLILRHPHVFSDAKVSGSGDVLKNWDEIKRIEKGQNTHYSELDSVARSLPSLWRAEKLQKKAAKVGFDWPDVNGALDKLSEEVEELKIAISADSNSAEELGDVLFSAVNVARFIKADPESSLSSTCEKFIARFRYIEETAAANNKNLNEMTLKDMDVLWEKSKSVI